MNKIRAWIFDLDGVITDPVEKKITEHKLLGEIVKRLVNGDLVAFNTGRASEFIKERVITPLKETLGSQDALLANVFAVGEKGGIWIEFHKNHEKDHVDREITVPENLQNEVRDLIKERYSDCVFFDETKKTMISIEIHDGYSLEDFKGRQAHLNHDLLDLIIKFDLTQSLKLDPSISATDIENNHVGKHLGATRIQNWWKEKGIQPTHILTFGDSPADFKMAEEFEKMGKTTYIYVGPKPEEIEFADLVIPEAKFTKGTLEYLINNI